MRTRHQHSPSPIRTHQRAGARLRQGTVGRSGTGLNDSRSRGQLQRRPPLRQKTPLRVKSARNLCIRVTESPPQLRIGTLGAHARSLPMRSLGALNSERLHCRGIIRRTRKHGGRRRRGPERHRPGCSCTQRHRASRRRAARCLTRRRAISTQTRRPAGAEAAQSGAQPTAAAQGSHQ